MDPRYENDGWSGDTAAHGSKIDVLREVDETQMKTRGQKHRCRELVEGDAHEEKALVDAISGERESQMIGSGSRYRPWSDVDAAVEIG